MFSRVFTLYALFTLFACMLMCASASPVALSAPQLVELDARGCMARMGGCKLADNDASSSATPTADTVPEATGVAILVDTPAVDDTPASDDAPTVDPSPLLSAAQSSGAILAIPSFGPAVLLGALASTVVALL